MTGIPHLDTLTAVTLGIFIVGLIYDAGVKAQRLRALEEWRREARDDYAKMDTKLDAIERLIRERA